MLSHRLCTANLVAFGRGTGEALEMHHPVETFESMNFFREKFQPMNAEQAVQVGE
jgi:hypothetical protein